MIMSQTALCGLGARAAQPHPLSVELHVHKEPAGGAAGSHGGAPPPVAALKPPIVLLTVVLQHLPALRVVTAHCKDPQDAPLLQALFPGDDGAAAPPEALSQLQAGSFRYSAQRAARPYRCVGLQLLSMGHRGRAEGANHCARPPHGAAARQPCGETWQVRPAIEAIAARCRAWPPPWRRRRWCQHLAGLDFVLPLPQLALQLQPGEQTDQVLAGLERYRRQQRAACVVQRLRQLKLGEAVLK